MTRLRSPRLAWLLLVLLCCGPGCIRRSDDSAKESAQRLRRFILDKEPHVAHRLNVDFSGYVKLLGYAISPEGPVRPGTATKLTLYWSSQKRLDKGWKLFTHVLDGSGTRILNIDNVGPLREGPNERQALAPSLWVPGKIYVDEQPLTIPSDPKGGKLRIVAGLWKGNRRLEPMSGPRDNENRAIVVTLHTGGSKNQAVRNTRVPWMHVPKLSAGDSIRIDGRLDERAWGRAAQTGRFVDVRTGHPNRSFPVNANAFVAWDDSGIYVGIDVRDADVAGGFDPTQPDPHLWTRDTVEIMIDPDGDGDNLDYYEIQINPQNLVFDSQFDSYNQPKVEPNGPYGHQEWASGVRSQVTVRGTLDNKDDRDNGYIVEALIPWKSLSKARRAPPVPGDEWRMNFYAMQDNGGVAWSPILGQGNFHKASRFGRVEWGKPLTRSAARVGSK